MIRVRLAKVEDQPSLIEFIRDHWSSTHIFAEDPAVFAWQHVQHDGRLNMMLAEQTTDTERWILGVLGFIPMGRYDATLGDADVLLAIWKVRDGAPPGLGLRLLKQLEAELRPRMIAAIGISEVVGPIYRVLRYDLGTLDHTAIFNPAHADRLRVAENVPASAFVAAGGPDRVRFAPIDVGADAEIRTQVDRIASTSTPSKSWTYVVERYLTHPWFDYSVRLVEHDSVPVAIVVWRQVTAAETTVLRIVDVIGDTTWLRNAREILQRAVVDAGAEYIDLVQWGIDTEVLDAAGLVGRRTHPEIMIPNYFSPFERRDVRIELAYKVTERDGRPTHLFRADSDQDRPNRPEDLHGRRRAP